VTQFENLRLHSHKGLRAAELTKLQRINVFCGPNNSGKTTVLECIASDKLRSVGIAAKVDVAEELAQASVGGAGWGRNPDLGRKYFSVVETAWKSRPVWFADEFEQLWDSIGWSQNFGTWASPGGTLRNAFNRVFADTVKSALVPAKRRLETIKAANSSEPIQTDGTGLLNFFFMAKNQNELSKARKDFERISAAFSNITQGFEFQVFLRENTQADLQFRHQSAIWIAAEDCGLGLQDVLIMLYFALSGDHEIVLIEEPENHLHPEIQRRLFSFLREQTERQFFLSTHSSVFLNPQLADRVFLCRFGDSVTVQNATSRAMLLSELGYSITDNLVSDVIVLCEGPTDKTVLEELFQKIGLSSTINIKIWPLGGDIMDQLDLSVFSQSYKVVALIDNDPGSSPIRKRFLERCGELKIDCHRLKRYALENYFSVRAIKEVMGEPPNKINELDPNKPVTEQLGFQVKRNAAKIAREIQLEEITGTDLYEFLDKVSNVSKAA